MVPPLHWYTHWLHWLFFQQSNQSSEAWRPLTFIALPLKIRAETATSLLLKVRSHLKIVWSKFAKDPSVKHWRFELFPFFTASKIFSLFFNQVDRVFFVILCFKATFDLGLPSSTSFSVLYSSLIDFVFNFRLVAIAAMMQASAYKKQVCPLYTKLKTCKKAKLTIRGLLLKTTWMIYVRLDLHSKCLKENRERFAYKMNF